MNRWEPHRAHRIVLAALALSMLLAACGISSDDTPRGIPEAQQLPLGIAGVSDAGDATGTARVYLLAPEVIGQTPTLQAVARDVDETAGDVLPALFAGPNASELDRQFRTALPADLELLSVSVRAGVITVDVSRELLQLSGQALIAAIAQIVFTCGELSGVRVVEITVDGADQQWPAGNGELQSTPLSVYDYPGLVPSAQPPYPAIPSPSQD